VRRSKTLTAAVFASVVLLALVGVCGPASAETATYRVLESQLRDGFPSSGSASDDKWYRADTTLGGGVTITDQFGASPQSGGTHSLGLTTNSQSSAKAQLGTTHRVYDTVLSTVTGLSYWTYQSSSSNGANDAAALQLQVWTGGIIPGPGFTTLVYVPAQNPGQPIVPDQWQFWDAANGTWYSTRRIECGDFVVEAQAPTTPQAVGAGCPDTVVSAFGVDVGSGTPNYIVAADGLHFATNSDSFTWYFGPGPK
jgi:hypothetical protein